MARRLYPIFLDMTDRPTVVVGGGRVAERKALELIECHAHVKLVAPEATQLLRDLAADDRIEWLDRPFQPADVEQALLVFAATGDPAVNTRVCQACAHAGILVNRAESPEASDFLVPATLRRGHLTVAVSTGGASPALASGIRDGLACQFGPEYAGYLDLLEEARGKVLREIADPGTRRRVLLALAQDAGILEVLRGQGEPGARKHVERIVSEAQSPGTEKDKEGHLDG
jgi:precorrin-2 dehydrogenase / sirohydrochlorin ferrochelatase